MVGTDIRKEDLEVKFYCYYEEQQEFPVLSGCGKALPALS